MALSLFRQSKAKICLWGFSLLCPSMLCSVSNPITTLISTCGLLCIHALCVAVELQHPPASLAVRNLQHIQPAEDVGGILQAVAGLSAAAEAQGRTQQEQSRATGKGAYLGALAHEHRQGIA
jgi:hypothetical protein